MVQNNYIMIVASECRPDVEDKFNKWYTEVHVPMFLKYPGVKQASRYKVSAEIPGVVKYLAIYEFENKAALDGFSTSEAFKEAVKDFDVMWKEGGLTIKWGAPYQLIKHWAKT
jgi:hypothetical protein